MYKILQIMCFYFFVSPYLLCCLSEQPHQAALTAVYKKVLVFAPHPDDDIIGCGGSIVKQRRAGNDVVIVYMTSGGAGGGRLYRSKEALVRIREQEATRAAHMLGVQKLYFLKNEDRRLTYNQKNLMQLIELLRQERPDIVYIPHRSDAHKDHKVTYQLVMEAIKRAGSNSFFDGMGHPWKIETVFCYEVWTPLRVVSYYEDISEVMTLKLQALRQHVSQLATYRHDKVVEARNRALSFMSKTGIYCEGFHVVTMSNQDFVKL